MLKLRVIQARYGDCSILEYDDAGQSCRILVDGGPNQVYGPYLRGELEQIAAQGGRLDLMVLSHIDNDHVRGLLELMRELRLEHQKKQPPLIAVERIWHNGFSKILPAALKAEADEIESQTAVEVHPDPNLSLSERVEESYGVAEGHELQEADAELNIPRNEGFAEQLVTLESAARPVELAGVRLWVIGPSAHNLVKLRESWVAWLMREQLPFAPGEKPVRPDEATNNLSSIMFLAEAGGRRILLTGDGVAGDIIDGLEAAGLLEKGGTLHVDVLKVPHHGSARNSVGGLYERVLADDYIISADGRYSNPDITTLTWIVDAACRQQRDVRIFATNPAPAIQTLLRKRPPKDNYYTLTILPKGQTSQVL